MPISPDQIPIRYEGRDGFSRTIGVKDLEHATLCRALGLDQANFWFELPSSARGVGSSSVGAGGNRGRRRINGYVWRAGLGEPWGKLTIASPGEKFKDVDPSDERDFFDLNHS